MHTLVNLSIKCVFIINSVILNKRVSEIKFYNKILFLQKSIRPICLPWGNLSNKNLAGTTITVTGWGALEYGKLVTKIELIYFISI